MSTIATTVTYGITLTSTAGQNTGRDRSNPLTVTSTGTIASGSTYAVFGNTSQRWTVYNDGLLGGRATEFGVGGVKLETSSTVTNAGTISGSVFGVYLQAGGTITNTGTASLIISRYIFGSGDGIEVGGGAGTVSNAGMVSGSLDGVVLQAGGTIANTGADSVIVGGVNVGAYAGGGAATISDGGTIIGGRDAVQFVGTFNDRLILDPGAVLVGAIVGQTGAGATNTLELAAGGAGTAGTLSNFGTFSNFGTIAVDPGASWDFAASNAIGAGVTILDSGTLENDGSIGSTVTLLSGAGPFDNTGTIAPASGDGVYEQAGAGTVTNAGSISGGDVGVNLRGEGTVGNAGTVSGGFAGVVLVSLHRGYDSLSGFG